MPKYVLTSILFIICSINGFSQVEENLLDGYQIFRYPNGAISSEGNLKEGKPDGYWKSYYITGIIKSEGKRTNHLLDSIWVFYDATGDTTEKINYLYGKKNGFHYKYKKDTFYGLYVESKELYVGDKIEGNAYIYFPSGEIKQIIPYNSNKIDGLSKEFDQEGNIVTLLEYNNDRLISRERINRIDNNGFKQGIWKEFYQSGTLKKEENFKDNNLHGYYREYDNNGKVVASLLYDNGSIVESAQNGDTEINIVNRYDNENRLIYSGPYRDNTPVGVHREYGPDGNITKSYIYNDNGILLSEGIVDASGNRNGNWKEFLQNGSVIAEGQYNNNVRVGTWRFYNNKGGVEQTGAYNNGRPDGRWTWYYDDNAILREEEYYRGQRDGIYKEYSNNGGVIVQGEYSDGEKNGFWRYNTGDIIEEGEYIVGLKEGEWKTFYPDGKIKYKGSYIQGNADGLHQFFYENGNLKEEQYYKMGLKQKTWRKYEETGALTLSITYRNDVETNINGIRVNLPQSDVRLIE